MKISSKSIKKKAEELGFQKVGIARAEKTPKRKVRSRFMANARQTCIDGLDDE